MQVADPAAQLFAGPQAESGSEEQKIGLGRFSVVDAVRLGALKQDKLNPSLST